MSYSRGMDVLGIDPNFARALAGRGVQVDPRSVDDPEWSLAKRALVGLAILAAGAGAVVLLVPSVRSRALGLLR